MKKVLALAFLLLLACVMADTPEDDAWVISAFAYGSSGYDVTPSLKVNPGSTLSIVIDSTKESRAVFKLWRVFPHPDADNFEISFEARVDAPNINLDNNKDYSGGEGTNSDGPNLFAFAYSYPDAQVTRYGATKDTVSFYSNKQNSSVCHVHFECNWVGDPEQYYGFYCSSDIAFQGWLADGYGIGQYGTNQFNQEPFESNEWKTVRLNFNAGECNSDPMSLVIMGVDALWDYPYEWEFRNFKIVGSTTQEFTFDKLYQYNKYNQNNYTKIIPPAYCGDLIKNANEECDGHDGESQGLYCQPDCTLKPQCGDNFLAGDEVCDGLKVTKGFTCAANCMSEIPVCGDGILVGDEICDPGAPPDVPAIVTEGFSCSADCMSEIAICGDGIVVGIEECDGTAGVPEGDACASDCTLYRLLTEDENAVVNKIIPLALEADFGQPAISEMDFGENGTLSITDLYSQLKLRNVTQLENVNFSFCTSAYADCEERYLFSEDFIVTSGDMEFTRKASTLMKVYKTTDGNDTLYLIGVKHDKSIIDFIYDPAFWMASGVLIAVILVAGVVLILSLVGAFLFAKKKGIPITKVPYYLLNRRKGL